MSHDGGVALFYQPLWLAVVWISIYKQDVFSTPVFHQLSDDVVNEVSPVVAV